MRIFNWITDRYLQHVYVNGTFSITYDVHFPNNATEQNLYELVYFFSLEML